MRIGGLQKTTLLDFPGKVSAVVFTQGCNFSCPYCHNPDLTSCREGTCSSTDALNFLARRRRVLEGVVVTGGEPTLQKGLDDFCLGAKKLGYAIKLDTNGSGPGALRRLLELELLDYVAMDVKAAPRIYPEEIAPGGAGESLVESLALLCSSGVPHEIRVPCAAPFVDAESFEGILEATGAAPIFLQAVHLERVLSPDFFKEKGKPMTGEEMEALRAQAAKRGRDCRIR